MRRIALLLSMSLVAAGCIELTVAAGAGAAAFTQCPPVDKDQGCQFLIQITSSGVTVPTDPSQSAYDGEDDTLIGVENTSSKPVSSFPLSSSKNIYGFDDDGLCDPPAPPRAPGCIVLAKNKSGETPTKIKPGKECEHEPADPEGQEEEEPCGFEPPGEPAGLSFPEGIEPVGFAANGDPVSGYEGPRIYFTNINSEGSSGTINISPALAPGEHTYFALEEALFESSLTLGSPTTVSTSLSGGGQSGSSITVLQGTAVTDTASLSGPGATVASGAVTYTAYSNPECTTVAASAGTGAVSGLTADSSSAVSSLAPGVYYWKASYTGDVNNQAGSSTCGVSGEVLTVQAPTTTTTVQTAGAATGVTIPVLLGTSVTDQAHVAGSEAPSATGTVTYTLYSDSKCTKAVTSSVGAVSGGVAGPSAPVTPSKTGTYYWEVNYSGGGLDAASSSACGSETLIVSKHANLGLPSGKECRSKRDFAVHPRFPKGAKIVRFEEFINGKLVKSGHLSHRATTVDLIGLPKGTYEVELVTFEASGTSYEDTRTYHTCVPKKHKHHKK
jgi:hypothetical protein